MNEQQAAALRAPFPPEQVGHLPRSGITLDYVGHADVTSRLLEVDPAWTWEPLALDEHGLPRLDLNEQGRPVGLWLRLTVCGVTRLGYGSCPANQQDAVKVLIGDALRNAAMRFGVALDLWAKGDRANLAAENPSGPAGDARRRPEPKPDPTVEVKRQIVAHGDRLGYDLDTLKADYREKFGGELHTATLGDLTAYEALLAAQVDELAAAG